MESRATKYTFSLGPQKEANKIQYIFSNLKRNDISDFIRTAVVRHHFHLMAQKHKDTPFGFNIYDFAADAYAASFTREEIQTMLHDCKAVQGICEGVIRDRKFAPPKGYFDKLTHEQEQAEIKEGAQQ